MFDSCYARRWYGTQYTLCDIRRCSCRYSGAHFLHAVPGYQQQMQQQQQQQQQQQWQMQQMQQQQMQQQAAAYGGYGAQAAAAPATGGGGAVWTQVPDGAGNMYHLISP